MLSWDVTRPFKRLARDFNHSTSVSRQVFEVFLDRLSKRSFNVVCFLFPFLGVSCATFDVEDVYFPLVFGHRLCLYPLHSPSDN